MQHGFIKVGAAIPLVSVADTKRNTEQLIILAQRAHEAGAEITVFPELCITGYTCGDLFTQKQSYYHHNANDRFGVNAYVLLFFCQKKEGNCAFAN